MAQRVEAPPRLSRPDCDVQVGDVWWLPEEQAHFPGGKDRFCLVVGLETPPGAQLPARVHYVVGSTHRGGPPEIVLEPGEANLRLRTHFRFWWSGDIDIASLLRTGQLRGRLDRARHGEIGIAIRASKRAVLKRLVR
jgi:hypothetical protein